VATGHTRLN